MKNLILLCAIVCCANGCWTTIRNLHDRLHEISREEKLYVLVTGYPYDPALCEEGCYDNIDKIEVIDKEGKTIVCSSGKIPKKVKYATGGVIDEHLLICGGVHPISKECHIMGKDMTWSKHADMIESRAFASSTVIQDYLWVTGGDIAAYRGGRVSYTYTSDTTEKIHLNGTVEPGINLPNAVWGHCMVQHQKSVYLLGGSDGERRKDVLKFLPEMGFTHSVVQPMKHARVGFACGVFTSKLHSNRPIMVAAGSWGGSGISTTGEFWDFTNPDAKWQPTGDFPYDLYESPQMTPTQNGDGVLLTHRENIFKLDCTNTTSCLWKKEPNSLQIVRINHLMFTVPSKLLENCNN